MKHILKNLADIYENVGEHEIPVKKFKIKIVIFLLVRDLFMCIVVIIYFYWFISSLSDRYLLLGFIGFPYAIPCRCLINTIRVMSETDTAITVYFCSVCYLLEESLMALNKKLQKTTNEDLESLFDVHREINRAILKINGVLQSNLLLSVITVLITVFRDAYLMLFSTDQDVIPPLCRILLILVTFLNFVLLCLFGSRVANAASRVKATAQNLSLQFSQLRTLHIVSTLKEGVEGFKLLNSIVIDGSLILSATGILLTYGILIATFSSSKSDTK